MPLVRGASGRTEARKNNSEAPSLSTSLPERKPPELSKESPGGIARYLPCAKSLLGVCLFAQLWHASRYLGKGLADDLASRFAAVAFDDEQVGALG